VKSEERKVRNSLVTLALFLPVGKGNNFFLKRQE